MSFRIIWIIRTQICRSEGRRTGFLSEHFPMRCRERCNGLSVIVIVVVVMTLVDATHNRDFILVIRRGVTVLTFIFSVFTFNLLLVRSNIIIILFFFMLFLLKRWSRLKHRPPPLCVCILIILSLSSLASSSLLLPVPGR
jgi:hypothetical protein